MVSELFLDKVNHRFSHGLSQVKVNSSMMLNFMSFFMKMQTPPTLPL